MKKSLTIIFILLGFIISVKAQNAQPYCAAKGNVPWEQWISRVSLAPANFGNSSVKEGYGNFTSLTGATLQRGSGNQLTISPQSSWGGSPNNTNMFWRVWIDYNGDGDFIDANEEAIGRQVTVSSGVFLDNYANFTVPATARLGNTRMRIAMKVGGYPTPCETFERGEVEDYTVQITDGGITPNPDFDLSITALPTTTVEAMANNVTIYPFTTAVRFKYRSTIANPSASQSNSTLLWTLYLSTDATLSADDYRHFGFGGAMGESRTFEQEAILIPRRELPNGKYYAFIKIDGENSFTEANETNNISVGIPFDFYGLRCDEAASNPWGDWLSRVQFNNIDNQSGQTLLLNGIYKAGYSPFATTISTDIERGRSYPLTITSSASWSGRLSNHYYGAWIDYNQDGDFSDVGEQIYQGQGSSGLSMGNIAIPSTAVLGKTILRVAVRNGGYPETCTAYTEGEVEDYSVNITEGTLPAGRDTLRLLGVTGPNTVAQGGQITLNVTIKNTGTEASRPTTPLSIYQNQQPWAFRGPQPTYYTLVSDKKPINRVIQPNETVTVPITFTVIPNFTNKSPLVYPPVAFGNTQVTIGDRAANYGVALYAFPNVDTLYREFNITPQLATTDLSIEMLTTDTTYGVDGRFGYQIKVKNQGSVVAKNVIARTTQGISFPFQMPTVTIQKGSLSDGFYVGDYYSLWQIGDLAVGESVMATVQFVDPFLASVFTSTVRNVYVYSNQMNETNLDNNNDAQTFTLRTNSTAPDLTLSDLTTPSVGTVGTRVDFTFRLKNTGNAVANQNYTIGCYLSTDNTLSADDALAGIVPTGNTPIGFDIVVPAAITIPANQAIGNYFLIIKADKDNVIAESNENNNILSTAFEVRGLSGVYCAAKGTFPWEQWIRQVIVFTNVVVTPFAETVKEGYGNFTNATPAVAQRGSGGLISIFPQSSWGLDPRNTNMFWRVWMDFNHDNDFDDAGEMVASRAVGISSGVFFDNDYGFSVPATALLGKTRMRVAMKVGGYPLPCETFERGEVEDYSIDIIDATTTSQALVAFGNLKAQLIDATVRLDWVKLSDNITGFEVEKSIDGKAFQSMEKIALTPFNTYYYAYDAQPTEGSNFYRLKMILTNGDAAYSKIQSIDYLRLADFSVFPNPTNEEVFVDLKSFENKIINLSISNALGKTVYNESITYANRAPHRLDVSELESGIYFIRIEANGKRAVVRKLQIMR